MSAPAKHSVTPAPEFLDPVWNRLFARLEQPLGRLEGLISLLFDRLLDDSELSRAREECGETARRLGVFGFPAAADLLRRVGAVLERAELGPSDAISMANMVEEARSVIASRVGDFKALPRTGFSLLVVGPACETTDEIIWTASNLGLEVSHARDGLFLGPSDAAAIVAVFDDQDADRTQKVVHFLRQNHPSVPLIGVIPSLDPAQRVVLAQSVTTVLDSSALGPDEVVVETQRAVIRHRQPRSVAVFGIGSDWLAERLGNSGLTVRSEPDLASLFAGVRSGDTRAIILTPREPDLGSPATERHTVLRLIRTDPQLRSAVVVVVDHDEDVDMVRRHEALRKGADLYVSSSVDLDELVVLVKSHLQRRGDTEALSSRSSGRGVEPWESAVVLIERMLLAAARRHDTVGVALIRSDRQDAKATANLDREITELFRGDSIVTRLDANHLVVALDGIQRQTLVRRMSDIYRRLSLHELNSAIACVECPEEGRSLNAALDRGQVLLERIRAGAGPAVLGEADSDSSDEVVDVLIIDPDPNVGQMLVSSLERRGLVVDRLRDGLDALEWLTGQTSRPLPRLVLLDLDLRDIDALAFLRLVADAGTMAQTKIVVLSPRMNESELRVAFELGIDDFVPKPLSIPLLFRRLCRALDR